MLNKAKWEGSNRANSHGRFNPDFVYILNFFSHHLAIIPPFAGMK
jgi:hypothetical protein